MLYDENDGRWHMWASVIAEHCGMEVWFRNSKISHASSDKADGIYQQAEDVFGVFSHEPNVVRAPTGEFVMFFTHKGIRTPPPRPPCRRPLPRRRGPSACGMCSA